MKKGKGVDKELTARAALALGWVKYDDQWFVPLLGHAMKLKIGADGISIFDIKFTISLDWSALGLEEVKSKHYDLDKYLDRLAKILGWQGGLKTHYYGEDINHEDQVSDIVQATPAEITQAWVEVLESKDNS